MPSIFPPLWLLPKKFVSPETWHPLLRRSLATCAPGSTRLQQIQDLALLIHHAEDLHSGCIAFHTVVHSGRSGNRFLCNLLLDLYGKYGAMPDALSLFRSLACKNLFTWNIFICSLVQQGEFVRAFQHFQHMLLEGVLPDEFTHSSIIDACASSDTSMEGSFFHSTIIHTEFESHVVVATALINMYSKHSCLAEAKLAFDRVQEHDTVSWSAIIDAYAKHGYEKISVSLFRKMQRKYVLPDSLTFIAVLGACATFSTLTWGRIFHSTIVISGFETDLSVGNALLNMYAKCGELDHGLFVFRSLPVKDVISWSAMISVYAQVGHLEEAMRLFVAMQNDGISPNEITYVNIISACSHEGNIENGLHYFFSISGVHNMKPTSEHYGCLIDLYARVGRLAEAEVVLMSSKVKYSALIWQTLLGACRVHNDVDRGKRVAEHIIKLDPSISASYVALSDFYACET